MSEKETRDFLIKLINSCTTKEHTSLMLEMIGWAYNDKFYNDPNYETGRVEIHEALVAIRRDIIYGKIPSIPTLELHTRKQ